MHTIKIKNSHYKPIMKIIRDSGIETPERARIDYSLISASSKVSKFKEECRLFEKKYKMSFSDFEKKIENKKEENFEKWDDYLAWKFANDAKNHWFNNLKRLKDA